MPCERRPESQNRVQTIQAGTITKFFRRTDLSLGIRAAAGLGKSTAVLRAIFQRRPGARRVEIYVPTHQLGQEMLELFRQQAPHLQCSLIRGRNQPDADGETPCRRGDEVTQLSIHEVNIYQSLCRNGSEKCPYFEHCQYLKQYRRGDHVRILTHSHLGLNRSRLEGRKPERAIIDESFWPQMIRSTEYKMSDITESHIQSKALRVTLVKALTHDWPLLEALRDRFGDQLDARLARELTHLSTLLPVVSPRMNKGEIKRIVDKSTYVGFERHLLSALREELAQCPERGESLRVRRTQTKTKTFTLVERKAMTRFLVGSGARRSPYSTSMPISIGLSPRCFSRA